MAKKTIIKNGKEYHFAATGATPRKFRNHFKRDMLTELANIYKDTDEATMKALQNGDVDVANVDIEQVDMGLMEDMAYIMCIDEKPATVDEWLEQFELMDGIEIVTEAFELWEDSEKTLVEAEEAGGSEGNEKK